MKQIKQNENPCVNCLFKKKYKTYFPPGLVKYHLNVALHFANVAKQSLLDVYENKLGT